MLFRILNLQFFTGSRWLTSPREMPRGQDCQKRLLTMPNTLRADVSLIYLAAREKQMKKTTSAGRQHSSRSIFKLKHQPADSCLH